MIFAASPSAKAATASLVPGSAHAACPACSTPAHAAALAAMGTSSQQTGSQQTGSSSGRGAPELASSSGRGAPELATREVSPRRLQLQIIKFVRGITK